MNICMLSLHSSPVGRLGTRDTGGMSIYIRELASELGARGHQVDIYTRRQKADIVQVSALTRNVRLIHLDTGQKVNTNKMSIYESMADFAAALDRFVHRNRMQYDLVHSHYWLSGCLGRGIQWRHHIPHLVMFHTLGIVKNMYSSHAPEPALRIANERQLAESCDRVMVAAESEKGHLQHYYGIEPAKVALVPCGVNLDRFRPIDKQTARRRIGLNPKRSILLYVGRFDPLKRIDSLIHAHARLCKRHPSQLLIIGGDGPSDPVTRRLHRLSRRLKTESDVTFIGRVDHEDLPPYYNSADVLVLPSRYESFGLVALEALACGTPVVATPVGAMEDIIRDGVNGRLLTDASPEFMADGIAAFVTKSKTTSSVRRIRASVMDYGWSPVAEAVIAEYETLLKSTGKYSRRAECN